MTVAQLARRIGATRRFTKEMLEEWAAAGIAVEEDGGWRLTEYGLDRFGRPLLHIALDRQGIPERLAA